MQLDVSGILGLVDRAIFTGGTGAGSTPLTSFDAALQAAGIHNANLIEISSVVPSGATVETDTSPSAIESTIIPGGFYPTVYASEASAEPGDCVYAAVAGCSLGSNYGINVERHGFGNERDTTFRECVVMLEEMAKNRNESITSDIWFRYESTVVPSPHSDEPWACAVAAVLYDCRPSRAD